MTRVLVVEDEPRLGGVIEQQLMDAQYTVDLAMDGEEALDFARTSSYDAIVLDVLLPRVDGLEVCRRLRAAGSLTPILLLTARDAVEDKIVGLDSGADDYLTKPFTFGELLARLRALLRRNAAQKSGVLKVAELTLDPASRVVRWRDRELELTARDYQVLETLMRRPGWVVTREAMIESVWGFGCSDSSNLVEVYIRRLRRALEEQGAPPLIQTVRGVGYRIQEPPA
jgi:two-component system OmpR family response regulator